MAPSAIDSVTRWSWGLLASGFLLLLTDSPPVGASGTTPSIPRPHTVRAGVWVNAKELHEIPMTGASWDALVRYAARVPGTPRLADRARDTNRVILAKALVYARTQDPESREHVVRALTDVVGTERGGDVLSLGRKLTSYVIAADLVPLPEDVERRFRFWLREVLGESLAGKTIRSTHEDRPNNWGTHAGASRVATACYLGLEDELERCARVFRGWLGDRDAYAGFRFGNRAWQVEPRRPVGINPAGATKAGHSIDGVLPDDQRRAGPFRWPPPHENYAYEALQGALVQAVILHRAGYDVWEWEDRALLRAFSWLHDVALFSPQGDDTWQAPLIDHFYDTHYWDGSPTRPGKTLGWTDWTHAPR